MSNEQSTPWNFIVSVSNSERSTPANNERIASRRGVLFYSNQPKSFDHPWLSSSNRAFPAGSAPNKQLRTGERANDTVHCQSIGSLKFHYGANSQSTSDTINWPRIKTFVLQGLLNLSSIHGKLLR